MQQSTATENTTQLEAENGGLDVSKDREAKP